GVEILDALAFLGNDDAVGDAEALVARLGFAREVGLLVVLPAGEILAVEEAGVAGLELEVVAGIAGESASEEEEGNECDSHGVVLRKSVVMASRQHERPERWGRVGG